MPEFIQTIQHLDDGQFSDYIKAELEQMGISQLPLQAGLSYSSYVSDSPLTAVILSYELASPNIEVKAGIFYSGIIGGCNCADDPSPVDEINEYCEIQILINRQTAEAEINLL